MDLLLTVVYTALMLGMAVSLLFRKLYRDSGAWPLTSLAAMLLMYGMLGWCANLLSDGGAFDRLPPTFEYPFWRTEGALTLADGTHVVPHTPSGRIQIYDRDWHYLRGWHVPTGGGDLRLLTASNDRIEVFIERGDGRATYDLSGNVLGLEWEAPRPTGERSQDRVTVPTPFLLRSFSSPMLSWCISVAGGLLLAFCHTLILRDEKAREGRAILEGVADLSDVAPEPRRDRP